MRPELELIKAHDLIAGILLGQAPNPFGNDPVALKGLTAAADVLCWALEHEHNINFALNLANLEAFTKTQGQWVMRDPSEPIQVCEVCGCTEFSPCKTPEGPCHWVAPGVCSGCVLVTNIEQGEL